MIKKHYTCIIAKMFAVSYCSRLQIRTIALATCVGYVRSIANLVVQHLQTCFFLQILTYIVRNFAHFVCTLAAVFVFAKWQT